jgi:hypothetical protein
LLQTLSDDRGVIDRIRQLRLCALIVQADADAQALVDSPGDSGIEVVCLNLRAQRLKPSDPIRVVVERESEWHVDANARR